MRPDWDETWMAIADVIAQRSLCTRRKAGCVLVGPDNRIVATGYNGPPAKLWLMGMTEKDIPCDQWCPRAQTGGSMSYDDCPSAHSEANALMYSDRHAREGGTAYVTSMPCLTCAKNLSNSGILRVVCRIGEEDKYREPDLSINMMERSGLKVVICAPLPS